MSVATANAIGLLEESTNARETVAYCRYGFPEAAVKSTSVPEADGPVGTACGVGVTRPAMLPGVIVVGPRGR